MDWQTVLAIFGAVGTTVGLLGVVYKYIPARLKKIFSPMHIWGLRKKFIATTTSDLTAIQNDSFVLLCPHHGSQISLKKI